MEITTTKKTSMIEPSLHNKRRERLLQKLNEILSILSPSLLQTNALSVIKNNVI